MIIFLFVCVFIFILLDSISLTDIEDITRGREEAVLRLTPDEQLTHKEEYVMQLTKHMELR